jgi:SpoVK/Ycf46/Vps4 family AAA+-type ATPase
MDLFMTIAEELFQLSRLALTGRRQEIQLMIRRISKRQKNTSPELAERLIALLRESPDKASPLRRATARPIPVDNDSRLQLVRLEQFPELDVEPVYSSNVTQALNQLIMERKARDRLLSANLEPSRSALFTGPPGVGKTLAAKLVAGELKKPLFILDLSAVMSSFLGRTGNNVRSVLDYAKETDCILLLDELDAVAKRRDDSTEVGELKRLVTVLLQEVDDWPADSLLLAATNHPDLLDPAVWRRFESVIAFPLPLTNEIRKAIKNFFHGDSAGDDWIEILTLIFKGFSYSDIRRAITQARRAVVVREIDLNTALRELVQQHIENISRKDRTKLAVKFADTGIATQRQASELTGVSRDTIRRHLNDA